jgi:hypothetical protein
MKKYQTGKYYYIKGREIPIYKGKLYVVVSNDHDKVEQLIPDFSKWSDGELYAHAFLMQYKGCESVFIVLNFDHPFERMTYGTIVHETRHAADLLANGRGLNTATDNTESNAYIQGWIADTVFMELVRWGFVQPLTMKRRKSNGNK